MNFMTALESEVVATIPERQATVSESLQLMAEGWGGIFIVIIIMMLCILVLNWAFSRKKKK